MTDSLYQSLQSFERVGGDSCSLGHGITEGTVIGASRDLKDTYSWLAGDTLLREEPGWSTLNLLFLYDTCQSESSLCTEGPATEYVLLGLLERGAPVKQNWHSDSKFLGWCPPKICNECGTHHGEANFICSQERAGKQAAIREKNTQIEYVHTVSCYSSKESVTT